MTRSKKINKDSSLPLRVGNTVKVVFLKKVDSRKTPTGDLGPFKTFDFKGKVDVNVDIDFSAELCDVLVLETGYLIKCKDRATFDMMYREVSRACS